MENPNEFRLEVNVRIENAAYSHGGVYIHETVTIAPVNFQEMAKILEAFHTLVEKYRKHG